MKKTYSFIIKIVLSILFLYIIIHKYWNYDEMKNYIQKLNYFFLLGILVFAFLSRYTTAIQLKICLKAFQIYQPVSKIYNAQQIATFYSFIVPGDIIAGTVTWHLLSKNTNSRTNVAGGLFLVRILNLVMLLPFAIISLYLEPQLDKYHLDSYIFITGIILISFLLPFFWKFPFYIIEKKIITLNHALFLRKIPKMANLFDKLVASVRLFHEVGFSIKLKIFLWSLIIQSLSIVSLWLSFKAVHIEVPFIICFWILPLISLISFLPITIAGTGFRELGLIFFLKELYGVSAEQSLLLSFIILLSSLFFGIWGGILHLKNK